METQVIMKRELFGKEISQQSKSGFFSATDLVKAGNLWRLTNGLGLFDMSNWFSQKGTIEFIDMLSKQFGSVKSVGKGRGHHTWVHPFLFIDMALAISPQLKLEVYSWLYDYLLQYRNNSGDSYKKMSGALYILCDNKREFSRYIEKVAKKIQLACNTTDWQRTTEEVLKLRDMIHNNIALLCDVLSDSERAVQIGIEKSLKNYKEQKEEKERKLLKMNNKN